jgi:rubrerythrin
MIAVSENLNKCDDIFIFLLDFHSLNFDSMLSSLNLSPKGGIVSAMKFNRVSEQLIIFNTDYEFDWLNPMSDLKIESVTERSFIVSTSENLQEAFAGESQANRKYLAFAKKAEQDGFDQVAKLFRAAAAAETVHAHAHFRVMGGVKGTEENLKAAIEGEGFEFQQMYPKFLSEAEAEGNKPAAVSFKNALAVEEIHHVLYTKALGAVKSGSDLPETKIFVCSICGNTVEGSAPDKCPVCGASREQFKETL